MPVPPCNAKGQAGGTSDHRGTRPEDKESHWGPTPEGAGGQVSAVDRDEGEEALDRSDRLRHKGHRKQAAPDKGDIAGLGRPAVGILIIK